MDVTQNLGLELSPLSLSVCVVLVVDTASSNACLCWLSAKYKITQLFVKMGLDSSPAVLKGKLQ